MYLKSRLQVIVVVVVVVVMTHTKTLRSTHVIRARLKKQTWIPENSCPLGDSEDIILYFKNKL